MKSEIEKIGKHTFAVVKSPAFKDWIMTKMTVDDFRKLSSKGKREIFLNWKWGTTSLESNESAEISEQEACRESKKYSQEEWDKLEIEDKDWFERKLKWNNHCYRLWKEIEEGILFDVGGVAKTLVKEFDGRIE